MWIFCNCLKIIKHVTLTVGRIDGNQYLSKSIDEKFSLHIRSTNQFLQSVPTRLDTCLHTLIRLGILPVSIALMNSVLSYDQERFGKSTLTPRNAIGDAGGYMNTLYIPIISCRCYGPLWYIPAMIHMREGNTKEQMFVWRGEYNRNLHIIFWMLILCSVLEIEKTTWAFVCSSLHKYMKSAQTDYLYWAQIYS